MQVDWKKVALSPGYMSLKAAYMCDIEKNWRGKHESLKRFNWVINRAKHYAYHQGVTLDVVLDSWERRRDCWWVNYYGKSKQPKFPSSKPANVQRMKESAYLLKEFATTTDKKRAFQMLRNARTRFAKLERKRDTKKKPRWGTERKRRYRKY